MTAKELADRARVTREALAHLRDETTDLNVATGLDLIVVHASDELLRQLRNLIR